MVPLRHTHDSREVGIDRRELIVRRECTDPGRSILVPDPAPRTDPDDDERGIASGCDPRSTSGGRVIGGS